MDVQVAETMGNDLSGTVNLFCALRSIYITYTCDFAIFQPHITIGGFSVMGVNDLAIY
ncbi:uncharacterized protein METZ01_LOCUS31166 [marine metagenome]|uniref:Uncharacterized protein n=1 Tax=marine metagenome TaxID=408172 RepID=A0A381QG50_9ZZZZ